jgi:FHA domain
MTLRRSYTEVLDVDSSQPAADGEPGPTQSHPVTLSLPVSAPAPAGNEMAGHESAGNELAGNELAGHEAAAELPAPDRHAVETLPAGSGLLITVPGHGSGQRFLLDAESTLAGRHPRSEIFLDDVTVSRAHAAFVRRDGRFVVRDAGSLNGTYVNHQRVDEVVLSAGDEVQIGKFRLSFYPSPQDGVEPAS